MIADSEFRAYPYIQNMLSELDWDTRNPARGGDVYTQGEFRHHDSLLARALGRKTPENIIVIPWDNGLRYWIVEAKRSQEDLIRALDEAKNYSNKINELRGGGSLALQPASPERSNNHFMSPLFTGTEKIGEKS